MVAIFAEADWYVASPEPEKLWEGELRARDLPSGPATRASLNYLLITPDRQLPVYAANVSERLAPFVGHHLLVRGKLIDLTKEGYGSELWIGCIESSEPER